VECPFVMDRSVAEPYELRETHPTNGAVRPTTGKPSPHNAYFFTSSTSARKSSMSSKLR
jgi:hypothetical protein